MPDLALVPAFCAKYGQPPRVFSAPGRVNLIGEHTDYNDGFVLPAAIERRTQVAGLSRPGRVVTVHSLNTGDGFDFDLDRPGPPRRGSWLDYVEGTAQALIRRGFPLNGASLFISSDVPMGAGLSASAALEVAVGYALLRLSGVLVVDRVKLALAGQAAEHEYVGTRCGIMDQYIAALGQAGSALLIDCRSLGQQVVPLELGDACLLICDTRVKHELANSAYNERRQECELGVELMRAERREIASLRDVSLEHFHAWEARLPELVRKRCRHVLSENERTLSAARALSEGRLDEVGSLMKASHVSLRDDFEVSCAELDEAVEVASRQPGVYGSRMTGGGFGGCTVTLLARSAVEPVSEAIRASFKERFASEPSLFATAACEGARDDP